MSAIRLLIRPTIFTAGVCGACFCGAAIIQHENKVKGLIPRRLEAVQDWIAAQKRRSESEQRIYYKIRIRFNPRQWYDNLTTGEKIAVSAIFMNLLVLCGWHLNRIKPVMIKYFLSQPSSLKIRLSPMILSCFSHSAPIHFAFNMCALYSFANVSTSLLGPEQLVGLFLSAGTVSSLASIASRVITAKNVSSLGASGALLGVIAYVCMKSPDSQLMLFFIPILAGNAIKLVLVMDFVGLVARWRLFDHAAHLGGSLFGIWYATYGEQLFYQHRRTVVDHWLKLKKQLK